MTDDQRREQASYIRRQSFDYEAQLRSLVVAMLKGGARDAAGDLVAHAVRVTDALTAQREVWVKTKLAELETLK